jgi:hypothetical protein
MDYPTQVEIAARLRRIWVGLWLIAFLVYGVGLLSDFGKVELGVDHAFQRSGALMLAIILAAYFGLEWLEFLTGNPGNFFDADNHYIPRSILGPTYTGLSVISTLIWGFGDLVSKGSGS